MEVVVCAARTAVDQHERYTRPFLFDIELGVADVDASHGQVELFLPTRRLRDFREHRTLDPNDSIEDRLALLSGGDGHSKRNCGQPDEQDRIADPAIRCHCATPFSL